MSDITNDLLATVDRLCEDHCTRELRVAAEAGAWQAGLWSSLEDLGFAKALLPESAGGAELEFSDAMAIVRRCAYHALPLPLAETMLASRLLMSVGLAVPEGPLTVVPPANGALSVRRTSDGLAVDGSARWVPWATECPHAVLVATGDDGDFIGLVATSGNVRSTGVNLGGEPRAAMVFEHAPLLAAAPVEGGVDRVMAEGALVRSVQMAGAIERALAYSLQYASERVQFGKPIAKFQAVQHMLAVMAGHVAAASAVSDMAVEASPLQAQLFAVAVAKARTGEAAGKAAEIAHQVHGAMGFTHEHNLHYGTRRLWSWRDEFGSESYWQEKLGRLVATSGADALWPLITSL